MNENERVTTLLARHYQVGWNDALDKVLEILKSKVLFPPSQSQKIYFEVKALHKSSEVRNG